jgi:hypothetical protein
MKDRYRSSFQCPVASMEREKNFLCNLTDNWQLTLTTHDDFRGGFKVVAAAARDPQRLRPLAIGGVVRSSLL